ncbi:unnamed protein product, partial [Mesorhabditis spiculigera]
MGLQTPFDKATHTINWVPIGDIMLKTEPVYDRHEPISIKKAVHFAACPFGGPIAIAECRPDSSWDVMIRTAAARPLLQEPIRRGDVAGIGWSRAHRLLILDNKSCVNRFKPNGRSDGSFYFSTDITDIKDYCIFNYGARDTGMAILDGQNRIFVVNSVKEAIPWLMQSPMSERPSAWCALHSSSLSSVICVYGNKFLMGQQGETMRVIPTSWAEKDGDYCRMSSDWNVSRVALYHSKRLIQIVSADLSKIFQSITVPGEHAIFKLGWVGESAVFLQRTQSIIQFFSVDDAQAVYEHTGDHVQVTSEPDGVRMYANTGSTFASPVSGDEKGVLGMGYSSQGAFLFEAYIRACQNRALNAFENLTAGVTDMPKAIAQCMGAACSVSDPSLQKQLLMAIRFGIPFCSNFDSSQLVRALGQFRIINEVRMVRTGIPLTYLQLEELSVKSLVNRLVEIGAFGVASRVSMGCDETKNDGNDVVLLEWVKANFDKLANRGAYADMTVLDEKIAQKFSEFPQVSFADAARRAAEAGLPQLARLLIKRETDEEKQVSVLLSLQDVSDALGLAAKAQKPELMHQVIRHLIKQKNRTTYELEIQKIPQARCLYAEYVTQRSGGALGNGGARMLALLEQNSDYDRKLLFHLDATEQADPIIQSEEHRQHLESAKEIAGHMKDANIVEVVTMACNQLTADWNVSTVRQQIIANASKPDIVQKTKQQYKLSDKQVTLWVIEGLAADKKWEQLFDMASKNHLMDWRPSSKPQSDTATNSMLSRVAAHIAYGNFATAAKLAYDAKDYDLMQRVLRKSHTDKEQEKTVLKLRNAM